MRRPILILLGLVLAGVPVALAQAPAPKTVILSTCLL
jgi:hypothetical protein